MSLRRLVVILYSTRAFRLKLKAWKVKRSDALRVHATSQLALPDASSPGRSSDDFALHTVAAQSATQTSPHDVLRGHGNSKPLEDLYIHFRTAVSSNSEEQGGPVLRVEDFVEGNTSVLHFAIKEPTSGGNSKVIERSLHDMHNRSIGVDTRDRKGRTALELAVRKDSSTLAALLLEHGASVDLPDGQGNTPLHTALQAFASPAMFHVLLSKGANPNTCVPTTEERRTSPLGLIAKIIRSIRRSEHVRYLKYLNIVGELLAFGAGWSSAELESIIGAFGHYYHVSKGSNELFESIRPVLRAYLEAGHDPAAVSCPAHLDGCFLGTLANFAAVHSPSPLLALFILGEVKVAAHVRSLVDDLLRHCDCPDLPRLPNDDILDILRCALKRMDSIDPLALPRLSTGLLMATLERSTSDLLVPSIRMIVSANPEECRFDSYSSRYDLVRKMVMRPFDTLCTAAEFILVRRDGVDDPGSLPEMMRSIYQFAFHAKPVVNIESRVRTFMRKNPCSEHEIRTFFLCVLHVVTKEILEQKCSIDPQAKETLIELIRIRQSHELPDLAISQKLLYNAFCRGHGDHIDEPIGCSVM